MEEAISGDVSLVRAWKADRAGNLVFRKSARNFNPPICRASKLCIAEVEEVVEVGEISPENIHVPGIYVDRIIVNKNLEKRIERRTLSKPMATEAVS